MAGISLVCCLGAELDWEFAPHHLPWYAARGVSHFHYILQSENELDPDLLDVLKNAAAEHGVSLALYHWRGVFNSNVKVRRMHRVIQTLSAPIVIADADEYIDVQSFSGLAARHARLPAVYGQFIDCFAAAPPCVASVRCDAPIDKQFPVQKRAYAFEQGLCGCSVKPIMLFREEYTLIHGLWDYDYKDFAKRHATVPILHMRWTTSRKRKSQERVELFRSQGAIHWRASEAAVKFLADCPIIERTQNAKPE